MWDALLEAKSMKRRPPQKAKHGYMHCAAFSLAILAVATIGLRVRHDFACADALGLHVVCVAPGFALSPMLPCPMGDGEALMYKLCTYYVRHTCECRRPDVKLWAALNATNNEVHSNAHAASP
jgi:hypothetical protein